MANDKLGRPTDQRLAVLRNQVSDFLMKGYLETTVAKAKAVARMAEKILTPAINTYTATTKEKKTVKGADGKKTKIEVVNDSAEKLNARRTIMSYLYDRQEQRGDKESKKDFDARTKGINHPLIEKIFNTYAPKYAERAKEFGNKGGYTRIIKLGARRGDAAEMARVELV